MRSLYSILLCLCFVFSAVANSAVSDADALVLQYSTPASKWEAALPVGNGRLGAMVYGGVELETLQLNEDTFWAGSPHNNVNPLALEALPKIRALINAGDYKAASALSEKTITSQGAQGMPYQSAGLLQMQFDGLAEYTDYSRELDIENAIARTRFKVGEVEYTREVFTSFTDQVIFVRLRASQKNALNFSLSLSHPDGMEVSSNADSASVVMTGKSRDHEGIEGLVKLANIARVVRNDGSLSSDKNALRVKDASEVLILVSIATNFVNYRDISADALKRAEAYLSKAQNNLSASTKPYEKAKAEHTAYYQQYFDRVSLNLGSNDFVEKSTEERIRDFPKSHDPHLVELYFQFGRYLLISSSQPGTQAANLQGIWNPHSTPPWDSKYTLNINFEMNYWLSESTQLTELNLPMIDLIRDLSESGKESAKTMCGARGWMAHHNTDIWRISGGIDWSWGSWPTSNAWLIDHLWQKYLYNGDEDFLASVYPIMNGACEFFEDFLVEDPKTGWLVVSPSISAENEPKFTGVKIAAGVTHDNQLLFDLFTHSIRAAEILGIQNAPIKKWKSILSQLPPMQIGQYHQLQEWLDDWDDPQDHHRHVSHLYGLFPSNQISPLYTPELFNAARVSMEQRGDPSTGWSMNWKINLWARLLDGNRAFKLIRDQIKLADEGAFESGGTYPNMFDAHPPFQIDGNFGFTSGIVEMLMQSHDGSVHLLPALPQEWPSGEVKGLVARGGFIIDMRWEKGFVTYLKVHSRLGGNLRLRSYATLPKAHGFKTKNAKGKNKNAFYEIPDIKKPLKHTPLTLPQLSLASSSLIDVATKAGQDYVFGAEE